MTENELSYADLQLLQRLRQMVGENKDAVEVGAPPQEDIPLHARHARYLREKQKELEAEYEMLDRGGNDSKGTESWTALMRVLGRR
jgi:hypothetical protein